LNRRFSSICPASLLGDEFMNQRFEIQKLRFEATSINTSSSPADRDIISARDREKIWHHHQIWRFQVVTASRNRHRLPTSQPFDCRLIEETWLQCDTTVQHSLSSNQMFHRTRIILSVLAPTWRRSALAPPGTFKNSRRASRTPASVHSCRIPKDTAMCSAIFPRSQKFVRTAISVPYLHFSRSFCFDSPNQELSECHNPTNWKEFQFPLNI
jgi:hypothetical protein